MPGWLQVVLSPEGIGVILALVGSFFGGQTRGKTQERRRIHTDPSNNFVDPTIALKTELGKVRKRDDL